MLKILIKTAKCNYKVDKYCKSWYEVVEKFYVHHEKMECQTFNSEGKRYVSVNEDANKVANKLRSAWFSFLNNPDNDSN